MLCAGDPEFRAPFSSSRQLGADVGNIEMSTLLEDLPDFVTLSPKLAGREEMAGLEVSDARGFLPGAEGAPFCDSVLRLLNGDG